MVKHYSLVPVDILAWNRASKEDEINLDGKGLSLISSIFTSSDLEKIGNLNVPEEMGSDPPRRAVNEPNCFPVKV